MHFEVKVSLLNLYCQEVARYKKLSQQEECAVFERFNDAKHQSVRFNCRTRAKSCQWLKKNANKLGFMGYNYVSLLTLVVMIHNNL